MAANNLARAGYFVLVVGLVAVLAVSVITLVKVNDNKNKNANTVLNNNTILNNTIYNNTHTIYNNTVYLNATYINNTDIQYFFDNGTSTADVLNYPNAQPAQTAKYQQAAKFISSSLDTSVSPCDDFYQYACGKYNDDISFDIADEDNYHKMADAYNVANGSDPLPVKQVKALYQQCLTDQSNWDSITANGTRVKAWYADFRKVTGLSFPLIDQLASLPNATQLSTVLGYLSGKYGVDTIVSQFVDTNWKDPQSQRPYLLYLDQPSLTLQWTYYIGKTWDLTKPSLYNRIRNTYMGFINMTTSQTVNPALLETYIQSVLQFEYDLANNYSTDATTRWQNDRSYNLIKIKDFNAQYPSIDINEYLLRLAIYADTNVYNRVTDPNYEISIMEPGQLDKLSKAFIANKNNQNFAVTFANYIYFRFLDSISSYYPTENSIEADEFLDRFTVKRPVHGRPRAEKSVAAKFNTADKPLVDELLLECVGLTMDTMQYANARVFIDKIYPTAADRLKIRSSVGKVVDSILIGMQSMIDQLSWMNADAKNGAYSKIKNLVRNIAYPDWITDNNNITQYYKNLNSNFLNSKDLPQMLDYLTQFNSRLSWSLLGRTRGIDRYDWNGPPGTVNAWYQPELNSISFPAAILRQPYFDPDWPASINFGAMGVVAGHELSHGFDSSGTQWDGFGQLFTWLNAQSQASFNNMTNCVIQEYNNFCPLNNSYSPRCINGQQTVGENVADNGGIHSAFRAYRNTINFKGPDPLLPGSLVSLLNHDQLFFLGFAQVWCQLPPTASAEYRQLLVDPHSPSKYRVFGTIQNFPAFRTAFNCPVGSSSAPADHCNVWISDVNITKDDSSSNVINIPKSPAIKADNNLYSKYSQAQQFFKVAFNFTADPCNDFYNYACGAYNKSLGFYIYRTRNYEVMVNQMETILAPGYNNPTNILNSTAIQKTLKFYRTCKNTTVDLQSNPSVRDGSIVQKVLDEFKNLTGYVFNWCETGNANTNDDPVTMAKALAYLSINFQTDTLVTPFVDVNAKRDNSFAANFTLYIDQNTLTYSKSYYQPGTFEKYTHPVLKSNMMNLIQSFTASRGQTCKAQNLAFNVENIISFEQLLGTNFSTDDTTRRNFGRWINPFLVKDLKYSFADWPTYVSELARLTGVNFTKGDAPNYKLLISEPAMLAALDAYIPKVGIDTVIKYLYYRLLASQSNFVYTPKSSFAPLYHESAALGKPKKDRDPFAIVMNVTAINCAQATQDYLQYANARIFTEALYKTDAARQNIRSQTMKVINAIKISMQNMLDALPWINSDQGTQNGARDKIRDLQINIAYPNFVLNNTQLDIYHNPLQFADGDDYFTMIRKLTVFNQYQNYINLTSTYIDRSNFLGPPGTVNAWYQPELNSITIPEGILQQPYFDADWPASVIFGAMGVIIGHELTHGFDDQGVQWDGQGVLNTWMSNNSRQSFADMAECVVDEYSNFTAITNSSYSPQNINGNQTQGENIADNGGIHSAWLSYQRWVALNGPDPQLPDRIFGQYSHDQLFFLSFAQVWCQSPPSDDTTYRQLLIDPHSPSKFRVFGTIQNFPAFRSAFNCPVGSVYAPEDHCSVWVPQS